MLTGNSNRAPKVCNTADPVHYSITPHVLVQCLYIEPSYFETPDHYPTINDVNCYCRGATIICSRLLMCRCLSKINQWPMSWAPRPVSAGYASCL